MHVRSRGRAAKFLAGQSMILRGKLRDPPVSDWEEQAALRNVLFLFDTIFVRIGHEANTAFFAASPFSLPERAFSDSDEWSASRPLVRNRVIGAVSAFPPHSLVAS